MTIVAPGVKIGSLRARELGAALDAGQAFEQGKGQALAKVQGQIFPGNSYILVKNVSGATLDQYSVVDIGNILQDYARADSNLSPFRNAFEADLPSDFCEYPAIIQQAAAANEIVWACVRGLTFARVDTVGSGTRVCVSSGSSQLKRYSSAGFADIIGSVTAISLIDLGGSRNGWYAYELTSAWSAGSCNADIYTLDGASLVDLTINELVYDPVGVAAGLAVGDRGICQWQSGKFYAMFGMACPNPVNDVYMDGAWLTLSRCDGTEEQIIETGTACP